MVSSLEKIVRLHTHALYRCELPVARPRNNEALPVLVEATGHGSIFLRKKVVLC